MCLNNSVPNGSKKFNKFVSKFDKHGYVKIYKRDKRDFVGDWFANNHIWDSGYVKAKNLDFNPNNAGFYGFLTLDDYKREYFNQKHVVCMVKKSWIIDTETNCESGQVGRACRCTAMVFPESGKQKVTVREFRGICKKNNV